MIGINFKLIVIILLVTLLGIGSIYANDSFLFHKMMKSKNFIFSEAVHPETNLISNFVDLEDPDHWGKTIFPSPDQIRNKVNNDREVPNLSNCPITGGRFLSILVDCFDLTQDMTGDSNWFNIYRKLLEYNNYARLRTMIDHVKIRYPYFPRNCI